MKIAMEKEIAENLNRNKTQYVGKYFLSFRPKLTTVGSTGFASFDSPPQHGQCWGDGRVGLI